MNAGKLTTRIAKSLTHDPVCEIAADAMSATHAYASTVVGILDDTRIDLAHELRICHSTKRLIAVSPGNVQRCSAIGGSQPILGLLVTSQSAYAAAQVVCSA